MVSKEVDPAYEITALVVKLERERRPPGADLRARAPGRFPVITNLHASRSRLATAMRAAPQEMLGTYLRAMDKPIPPRVVTTAPVKDVILTGDRLNLYDLPQIIHHEGDGAPSLTAAISFARSASETWNRAYNRLIKARHHVDPLDPRQAPLGVPQDRRGARRGPARGLRARRAPRHRAWLARDRLIDEDERAIMGGLFGEPLDSSSARPPMCSCPRTPR